MVTIFANKFSQTVELITDYIKQNTPDITAVVGADNVLKSKSLPVDSNVLIYIGDTFLMKKIIAETFELTMFYDKFAERSLTQYCMFNKKTSPPQHLMDKLCALPETFNNFPPLFGLECGCCGEYNKRLIFVVPDNFGEARSLYETYIKKSIDKIYPKLKSVVYKIFALNPAWVFEKLNVLDNKFVSHTCETVGDCDFRLIVTYKNGTTPAFIAAYDEQVKKMFGNFLYATHDTSLQQQAVEVLLQLGKHAAIAESVTGGLISSKIVEVSGASKVLHEGLVVYSTEAKSSRLHINPLFIDKYGVVSGEVARSLVENLLKGKQADFCISTTGYAGPEYGKEPLGLCYIGIGTAHTVKVFRFEFNGDRNHIRIQAANSALFLLLSAMKNIVIDAFPC